MTEKPYFTRHVSKSGDILLISVPVKDHKDFPKGSKVRVELINKPGDPGYEEPREEEVNLKGLREVDR